MAVVMREIFSDIESERRVVPVVTQTAPGTAIIRGGRPMVTVTGSGDYNGNAITLTVPGDPGSPFTLAGGRGGVGLKDLQATATPTGTFAGPVTGASAATAAGTPVYAVMSSTEIASLTLTVGSNVKFGVVDAFLGEKSGTETAVTIGVNLG